MLSPASECEYFLFFFLLYGSKTGKIQSFGYCTRPYCSFDNILVKCALLTHSTVCATIHSVDWDCVGCKASPDPLHGNVGMSALWATMEEATLSPRAHMALHDGPERERRAVSQWDLTNKCIKTMWIILWLQSGFYPRKISLLCSTSRAVWDFLRHDPIQPTQPVNEDADTHRCN